MGKWMEDKDASLLKKICARKYFHNAKHFKQGYIFKDMILPLSDEDRLEDYDCDIVFIPGQTSHPLRSWRMHEPGSIFADRFLYKTWITEYLIPDIE